MQQYRDTITGDNPDVKRERAEGRLNSHTPSCMNSVWQKVGEVFSALYFGSNNILYSPQSIQNRSYTFRLAVRVFCNKSTPGV